MRLTLFQMSFIRFHALRGRTNEWIARRLEMAPHDVFVALSEMSNGKDSGGSANVLGLAQPSSKSDAGRTSGT